MRGCAAWPVGADGAGYGVGVRELSRRQDDLKGNECQHFHRWAFFKLSSDVFR